MDIEIMKRIAKEEIESSVSFYEVSLKEELDFIKQILRRERSLEVVRFSFFLELISKEELNSYRERLNKY